MEWLIDWVSFWVIDELMESVIEGWFDLLIDKSISILEIDLSWHEVEEECVQPADGPALHHRRSRHKRVNSRRWVNQGQGALLRSQVAAIFDETIVIILFFYLF